MVWMDWKQLPHRMRNDAVFPYYQCLEKKKASLWIKRFFDAGAALLLLLLLSPLFLLLCLVVKCSSKGAVFFRQTRVTQYGREFSIYKFRTMAPQAEAAGAKVTLEDDERVTSVGRLLRASRLDELPQLLNVLRGDMSFVGTRPEVPGYVERYSDEMLATLLLPAGITSPASIAFCREGELLAQAIEEDLQPAQALAYHTAGGASAKIGEAQVDRVYLEQVLPGKMKLNLAYLREFRLLEDAKVLVKTILAVVR